jgi:hypothetical protein
MAFQTAQKSRVLLGKLHLSGYAKGVDSDANVTVLDTTSLVDTAYTSIPGQDTSTFDLDLMLDTDTTAGGEWDVLTTWKSTQPQVLSFAPVGLTTGSPAILVNALQGQMTPSSPAAGLVMVSVSAQTDGYTDIGVVVEDLTAVTTDTTGTARDGAAASSNGGVAHIHATAFSGLTSDVVTIEHSVDGAGSWATLVTFATITGTTSERVVVAPATTVRRYLRVVDDVTGTGSVSRQVSFARR